jgi:hypothetical protein
MNTLFELMVSPAAVLGLGLSLAVIKMISRRHGISMKLMFKIRPYWSWTMILLGTPVLTLAFAFFYMSLTAR